MILPSPTVTYFGEDLVNRAIADYFARNGLSEKVRDELMLIANTDEDAFFEIIDQFVMRTQTVKGE